MQSATYNNYTSGIKLTTHATNVMYITQLQIATCFLYVVNVAMYITSHRSCNL